MKCLEPELPVQRAESFRREFDLLKTMDVPGVARPIEFIQTPDSAIMVLEDFPGVLLEDVLAARRPDWLACLQIASRLARALEGIHASRRIHGDIRPGNLLVTQDFRRICLVDFGRAEPEGEAAPALEEGTGFGERDWAYLSPEQTGRMGRPIDHRTDFYSLGVLLYRMLTGKPPFQADDPLEWAHSHIARMPRPPAEAVPDLPRTVSDIVMKLLSKQPEERYQSAHGLGADLEHCLEQFRRRRRIESFALGGRDIPDRPQFPGTLYGREQELARLSGAFDRVRATGKPELMLVSGFSGIGKSSLVQALQGPVARARGFFLSGKFDPYKRNIPYSTVAQAFQEPLQEILAGSEGQVSAWKTRIQDALGILGKLVIDIIPHLEVILGKQPPVPELPPLESQIRFNSVFRLFLGAFARNASPVALFLDDLQWADPASLDLVSYVVTHPETRDLIVIGAYRSDETEPSHSLMSMRDQVRSAETPVGEITLLPLGQEPLSKLVADTFRCGRQEADPLADLVHGKAGGNPFFAIQFLTRLHQDRMIEFDSRAFAWRWDIPRIVARGYTGNIVELLVEKLNRLPMATRDAMMLAACMGSVADAATLAMLAGSPEEKVHDDLRESVREGLMVRKGGAYRFTHDRIQQAAYTLVPAERRVEAHLRIGRLLLAHVPREHREDRIFEIASQFALSAPLIGDPAEKAEVAEIFLLAGRRAKASTAYRSAADLMAVGMSLLQDQDWELRREPAYALHLERAECEWLSGGFHEAERLLAALSDRARTNPERLAVYRLEAQLHKIRGEMAEAIGSGLNGLRLVGIDWPSQPSPIQVQDAYAQVWGLIGGGRIEDLLDLPPMTDGEMKAAMEIASTMVDAAVWVDADMLQLLACFMVSTSIRHGNSESSPFGYAFFGGAIGPALGRFEEAYRLGRVAYALVERQGAVAYKPKICFMIGGTILLWVRPYRTAKEYYEAGFRIGAEIGDILWASYCASSDLDRLFVEGDPLDDVFAASQQYLDFARKHKIHETADSILIIQRMVQNLRGRTADFSTFDGEGFDQARFEETLEREYTPLTVGYYYVWKLQARFLSGDYRQALAAGAKAREVLWANRWLYPFSEFHYYHGLTLAALSREAPPERRKESLVTLAEYELAYRGWAASCPANFASKHALIAAEIARIAGKAPEAERRYEDAIRLAREGGLLQNEAIAYEMAAGFYRERALDAFAALYLREARARYLRWGAHGKVRQLDALHPERLARENVPPPAREALRGALPERGSPSGRLDFLAVLKASLAISGEIVSDRLQERLMRILMESAGAQKGWLILSLEDGLSLAADASVDQEKLSVRFHPRQEMSPSLLPSTLVNYVLRTRDKVILPDATRHNPFSGDEYLLRQRPKSVLCFPILRQAELVGIIYLENRLVANAFTPDRLEVLEIMASQAAISLENARLYESLQRENAERKQAEEALGGSRQLMQNIINTSTAVIYVKDLEGRYLLVNHRYEEVFHVTGDSVIGRADSDVFPGERADVSSHVDGGLLEEGWPVESEEVVSQEDGPHTYLAVKCALRDEAGKPYAVCGISTDITHIKLVEEQFRQSQKMEAIGRLAGGIAHDFNNLLTAINGYSSLALAGMEGSHPLYQFLREILKAGERAAGLTRQLLAYSRKQVLEARVWNLNTIISEIVGMLKRLIGEDVELVAALDSGIGLVKVDRGQVEQILLNLVVNARDAMPKGGRLVLETGNVLLDQPFPGTHLESAPGPHVMMAVSDTGMGMTPEVKAKLFEPFFTTKEVGKGTGLGLSVVYGIVKQSGGSISVYSEAGKGTTFRVYFPEIRQAGEPTREPMQAESRESYRGDENILLVEDDESVRRFARHALEAFGYKIIEAGNGSQALQALEKSPLPIDLVITDVVMPDMGGMELAARVGKLLPSLPILYISGFTENPAAQGGGPEATRENFLQKPFTPSELAKKVRETLSRASPAIGG